MRTVQDVKVLYGTMVAIDTVDNETFFGILSNVSVNNKKVIVTLSGHEFTIINLNSIYTLSEWKSNKHH